MTSDKELKAFERGIVKTILGKPCNRHTPEEREIHRQWLSKIDSRSAVIPLKPDKQYHASDCIRCGKRFMKNSDRRICGSCIGKYWEENGIVG